MPELPEVEIVKQSLKKKIKNKKIIKVIVRNRNLRFKLQTNFEKNLTNRLINQILRISKYLILVFDNLQQALVESVSRQNVKSDAALLLFRDLISIELRPNCFLTACWYLSAAGTD